MKTQLVTIAVGLLLVGCGKADKPPVGPGGSAVNASTAVYFGGTILTMAGAAGAYDPDEQPQYVEAVVVQDGKIAFTGPKAEAVNLAGPNAALIDLGGKTLLPGFIDSHGHVIAVGLQAAVANLLPPPDGTNDSIDKLLENTNAWAAANQDFITKAGWIIGFGYDDSQLTPTGHPSRLDLDKISRDVPVIFVHQSAHLGVLNTVGLAQVGVTACGEVDGGTIVCEPDGETPSGLLLEDPFVAALASAQGGIAQDTQESMIEQGMAMYARFGYTTAQDGRATVGDVDTLIRLAEADRLILDVASYPDVVSASQALENNPAWVTRTYNNHFRIGGVKLSLDGSPQGKTAWLTQPYKVPPAGEGEDYVGFPAYSDDVVEQAINKAFQNNWQLLTHCNGDQAGDQFVKFATQAAAAHGNDDRRSVMIHAQIVRADQLDQMKTLGVIPSFFTMHTFYWGDWHRTSVLGEPRALNISPTRWALDRDMIFTTHHDAPVAFPDSLRVLHATVNRITRNPFEAPYVLGPEQRVSAYVALLSITRWAAYQYFEEAHKGTIETGKLADFVILSGNPLEGDPMDIINLKIVETIKEGETIYRAEGR